MVLKVINDAGKTCLKVCKKNPVMTSIVVVLVVVVVALSIYGDKLGAYKEGYNPQPNSMPGTVPQTVELVKESERKAQAQVVEGFTTDIQSADELIPTGDKSTIAMFHATWCGYCKRFLPHFDAAIAECNGKPGMKYTLMKVDHDQHDGLSEKYEVKGFPTVVMIKADGSHEHLECPRDETFVDFVKSL